nr:MAG TPA: hypothetical protein [Caudoviricetes sp.]
MYISLKGRTPLLPNMQVKVLVGATPTTCTNFNKKT